MFGFGRCTAVEVGNHKSWPGTEGSICGKSMAKYMSFKSKVGGVFPGRVLGLCPRFRVNP